MAELPDNARGPLSCTGISSTMVSNADTLEEMQRFKSESGALICPHTAVGTAAARRLPASEACTVILSTAHAAKFPETVLDATGDPAPLPSRCQSLRDRGEVFERTANDLGTIKDLIRTKLVAEA
ncbi:MAG: threonine synthase, partial [Pseudomonadota bacterium]